MHLMAVPILPSPLFQQDVTSIDMGAFHNCTSLTDVTFQGTPTSISTSAFNGL